MYPMDSSIAVFFVCKLSLFLCQSFISELTMGRFFSVLVRLKLSLRHMKTLIPIIVERIIGHKTEA